MTYPIRPLAAPVWRLIHPGWHREPFSGEGARLVGGRWNRIGQAALYLTLDYHTAVLEYYQGIPKPGTLTPYVVEAASIADLTNGADAPADERIAAALAADWKTLARIEGKEPPSWALAQELIAAGADGALVPSVQNRGGTNLVLWRWHDAGQAGAREAEGGAALALLDPEAVLAGR